MRTGADVIEGLGEAVVPRRTTAWLRGDTGRPGRTRSSGWRRCRRGRPTRRGARPGSGRTGRRRRRRAASGGARRPALAPLRGGPDSLALGKSASWLTTAGAGSEGGAATWPGERRWRRGRTPGRCRRVHVPAGHQVQAPPGVHSPDVDPLAHQACLVDAQLGGGRQLPLRQRRRARRAVAPAVGRIGAHPGARRALRPSSDEEHVPLLGVVPCGLVGVGAVLGH